MQKLALDFVKTPALTRLAVLLLLSGVVLGSLTAVQYWRVKQQSIQLAQQLATLQAQRPAVASDTKKSRPQQHDVERLQAISAALASPWSPLFAGLESTSSDDVALLAIQPDAGKHQLRITAEAGDYAAVLAYLQRLEKLPQLHDIHLVQHEIIVDEQKQPVRFIVAASWDWPA